MSEIEEKNKGAMEAAHRLAMEMQACHEDAVRVFGFDPEVNLQMQELRQLVAAGAKPLDAMTTLVASLEQEERPEEAQSRYRNYLASAYHILCVEWQGKAMKIVK